MSKSIMNAKPHTLVAREKYAWPGGYLLVAIMDDGGQVCPDCVRENYRIIAHSTLHKMRDGWQCVGFDSLANYNHDEAPLCDHCGRELTDL